MKASLYTAILVALIEAAEADSLAKGQSPAEAHKASADMLLRTIYRFTGDSEAEKDALNELIGWMANRGGAEHWAVSVKTDIQFGEWLKGGLARTVADEAYLRRNLLVSVLVARFYDHLGFPCKSKDNEIRNTRRLELEAVFSPAIYFTEMVLSSDPGLVGKLLRRIGENLTTLDPELFVRRYQDLPEETFLEIRQQLLRGYNAAIGEEIIFAKSQEKAQ